MTSIWSIFIKIFIAFEESAYSEFAEYRVLYVSIKVTAIFVLFLSSLIFFLLIKITDSEDSSFFEHFVSILHSYQRCERIPFPQHLHQHLLLLVFLTKTMSRCDVISHCGFDLHFSDGLVMSIFSHTSWPSVCLLWENVYPGPLPNFFLTRLCLYMCVYVLEKEN